MKGSPDKRATIQEIAFRAWQAFGMPEGVTPGLDETVFWDPPNCVFPFGAHGCEVEVDRDTGAVRIHEVNSQRTVGQQLGQVRRDPFEQ